VLQPHIFFLCQGPKVFFQEFTVKPIPQIYEEVGVQLGIVKLFRG
jgi:hypothetical protein